MSDNPTEEELERIVNSKKCKSVKINGKNYYISKKVKDELKKQPKEGGFAFLAAIPWAIGALATATGISAGIAKTVTESRDAINKQKQGELLDLQKQSAQELIKKNTPTPVTTTLTSEVAHKGQGIYLNPYQGTAIHKYFKNIDPKFKGLTKKFKKGLKIKKEGKGIYLNPYKTQQGKGITETETEDETETEEETEQ